MHKTVVEVSLCKLVGQIEVTQAGLELVVRKKLLERHSQLGFEELKLENLWLDTRWNRLLFGGCDDHRMNP